MEKISLFTLILFRIVNSIVYYGLSLQAAELGSNIFETFTWLSFVEIPAVALATFAMEMFGRRKVLIYLLILAGLSCLATIFLPKEFVWLTTALSVFGKSNISASFALIYIYSVEIFPTVLRSSGLGLCSMFSRIGGILAPHVAGLVCILNCI